MAESKAKAKTWFDKQNIIRGDYRTENKQDDELNWKLLLWKAAGWVCFAFFAITIPTLVYYTVVNLGTYTPLDSFTCLVNTTFRVPCGRFNITDRECVKAGCCYDKTTATCYHYLPSRYSYDSSNGEYVVSHTSTPFGTKSVNKLSITVDEISSDKVRIKLHDENTNVVSRSFAGEKNYMVKQAKEKLIVEVYRNGSNELLLSTAKGPLIASENYWEWTMHLTNQSLFGINQTLISLDSNSSFSTVIYKNKNNHHSLPAFWAYTDGKFHGVVIRHEGPLEVTVLPSNLVDLRSLAGGYIELELSVGPTPKQLHDQQMGVVNLPPYWSLGILECRKTEIYNVTEIIEQFSLGEEAQNYCIDDNLLMALMKDNATNLLVLNETLNQMSEKGKKFLLSVPPQILVNSTLHKTADNLDVLYKYNNSVYNGVYLGQKVVYPDYSRPNIQAYLDEFNSFLKLYINVNIDGLMLNDNWPEEDTFKINGSAVFPYFPEMFQEAMSNTIPWNATSNDTLHILKHNSYGPSQMEATLEYFNKTNPKMLILSPTKSIEQTEPSLIENVDSSWDNLRQYIDNILFDSITGNHLVSLPLCGDTDGYNSSFQETLCIRWYIVAATMPLFRISSPKPWREPASLSSKYAEQAARVAIRKRQTLLPYYYTILTRNEPVIRPMFYDYYENTTTFSMKEQYMIGEKILVAQPLSLDRKKLQVYLPGRVRVWYEFWGGGMYTTNKTNSWVDIEVVETDFLAFIAQGSIVPLMESNEINLFIGLNCTQSPCAADGLLWLDNYVNFVADENSVTVSNMMTANCSYTLGYVQLYSYSNTKNFFNHYLINQTLCNADSTVIQYEDFVPTEPPSSV